MRQVLHLAFEHTNISFKNRWGELFSNPDHFNLVTELLSDFVEMRDVDVRPLPNPDFETTPRLSTLLLPFRKAFDEKEGVHLIHDVSSILEELDAKLLFLLGFRSTEGSVLSPLSIPVDRELLLHTATKKYNEHLSIVARSWSKHAFKCKENYWGEIQGSPEQLNNDAEELLNRLLMTYTWWNVFSHFKHGLVYELRDKTGHGARWKVQGPKFIGFVEPVDVESGLRFV